MSGEPNERRPRPAAESESPESAAPDPAATEAPGRGAVSPATAPVAPAKPDETTTVEPAPEAPGEADATPPATDTGDAAAADPADSDQQGHDARTEDEHIEADGHAAPANQPEPTNQPATTDQPDTPSATEPSAAAATEAPDLAQRPVTNGGDETAAPAPAKRTGGLSGKWILVLLIVAAGAAYLWYREQPAPAPSTEAPPTSGLATAELTELEQLLGALDFEAGSADGVVDDQTRAAIRLFQEFADLPVDGEPSEALLTELREVAKLLGKDG